MKRKVVLIVGVLSLFFLPLIASAQKPQRIRFAKGATSGIIKGRITGFAIKDYVVGAREGQTMTININSPKAYFVIYSINGRG